ncbi:MAG: dephospho-CoA kinase [Gammaproteobacteria bacterium]|nr:dephospho-CoA kinase [Gammaproteobacteria bacterium]
MYRPFRIGMTGGIGSGKSTVGECFRSLGVEVLDADQITRELTAPEQLVLDEIRSIFGNEAINSRGELSRTFLRSRIFTNNDQRKRLEALLHPRVYERLGEYSDKLDAAYVVWIVPLLLETRSADRVDRVLVIDCPEELQVQRAAARDQQSGADIREIMNRQLTREARLKQADDVILNDGELKSIRGKVQDLHHKYLSLAENRNKTETRDN